jgi:hypothetical protein
MRVQFIAQSVGGFLQPIDLVVADVEHVLCGLRDEKVVFAHALVFSPQAAEFVRELEQSGGGLGELFLNYAASDA